MDEEISVTVLYQDFEHPRTFLKRFQEAVTGVDGVVCVSVCSVYSRGAKALKHLLENADAASRINVIHWLYYVSTENVREIAPLLSSSNCSGLKTLELRRGHNDLDYVSEMLAHGCKATTLSLGTNDRDHYFGGEARTFFRTLARSKVVKLSGVCITCMRSSEFEEYLCEFLHVGTLKELNVMVLCKSGGLKMLEASLWHVKCSLTKLRVYSHPDHERDHEAVSRVNEKFARTQEVFVLLQGRQLRRLRSSLQRLPVEMVRMVAAFI